MIVPGTMIWTPLGFDCGFTSTVQVPAPSPASATASRSDFDDGTAGHVQVRVRERHRIGEELRIVRGDDVDEPGAGGEHRCLDRARRVRPGGRGGGDERRLDLAGGPAGMPLEQEGGGAGDVRRSHARPVEDGEGAAEVLERGREDLGARCADVRLQLVSEGRQPAGREARDDAAAAGVQLLRIPADPDPGASAAARQIGAQGGAVEVGDHSARDGELDRHSVGLARPVVDEDDADRARGAHARGLQRERAVPARDQCDRPVQRARGQRRRAAVEVAGRAAEVAGHRSAVRAHDRADVDELLVGVRPGRRRRTAVRTNGTWVSGSAAPGAVTVSAGP